MTDLIMAGTPRVVIAIPARNEEARIGQCFEALGRQVDEAGQPLTDFEIVLLVNNSSDGTRQAALSAARRLDLRLTCIERALEQAQATAGWARRLAMEAAAERAASGGILLTTDADSRPQPHWLARNLAHLTAGAEAVAGEIDWDPADPAPDMSANRRLEVRYAGQCARLVAAIDPIPHDPWPNHRWAWGASLAVWGRVYREVGGMPAVGLAEDRAFQAVLLKHDVKIRHACDVRVWTSGRTEGRAPGGLADLLRSFADDETALCDALLEPPRLVLRKAAMRGRMRRAWVSEDHKTLRRLIERALGPSIKSLTRLPKTFGALWAVIEAEGPRFAGVRVEPRNLARYCGQMARLQRRIDSKRDDAQNVQAIMPVSRLKQGLYSSLDGPQERMHRDIAG